MQVAHSFLADAEVKLEGDLLTIEEKGKEAVTGLYLSLPTALRLRVFMALGTALEAMLTATKNASDGNTEAAAPVAPPAPVAAADPSGYFAQSTTGTTLAPAAEPLAAVDGGAQQQ